MESAVVHHCQLAVLKLRSILNNVVAFEQDTAESIVYVDGEDLTMQGERHEILTALEALHSLFKDR